MLAHRVHCLQIQGYHHLNGSACVLLLRFTTMDVLFSPWLFVESGILELAKRVLSLPYQAQLWQNLPSDARSLGTI